MQRPLRGADTGLPDDAVAPPSVPDDPSPRFAQRVQHRATPPPARGIPSPPRPRPRLPLLMCLVRVVLTAERRPLHVPGVSDHARRRLGSPSIPVRPFGQGPGEPGTGAGRRASRRGLEEGRTLKRKFKPWPQPNTLALCSWEPRARVRGAERGAARIPDDFCTARPRAGHRPWKWHRVQTQNPRLPPGRPPPPAGSVGLGVRGGFRWGPGFLFGWLPGPQEKVHVCFPLSGRGDPAGEPQRQSPGGAASAGAARVCAAQQRPAAGAMRLDRAEAAADNEPLERQPTQSTASIAARGPAPPLLSSPRLPPASLTRQGGHWLG